MSCPRIRHASHWPVFNSHLTKSRLNDAPRLCQMQRRSFFSLRHRRGQSGTVSGARRMSTSTGAFVLAGPIRKKSSRKILPQYFFGSAAIAGLVLGCAWTVYSNIIAASVYPSVNSAEFDAPAIKRPVSIAARPATPSFNDVFASLPSPPALSKPDTVLPSIMFNERFAAASPQGEPSRVVADNSSSPDAAKR